MVYCIICFLGGFNENIARVGLNEKMFHIGLDGKPLYEERFTYVCDYKDGVSISTLDGMYYNIDKKGKIIE